MKKQLLLIFSLTGLAGLSIAQPVIQSSDISNIVGETYTVNVAATYQSEGAAGANQTWDFSGLTSGTAATIEMQNPSSTASGSQFTSATVSQYIAIQSTYMYFGWSSSEHTNYGLVAGGATIPYSNPEVMFNLPLTYGNTHTDDFDATFTSQGYLWDRSGSVSSEVDGYGTLITPSGTFTDVLRVKVEEDYQDDLQAFPQSAYYQSEVYHWYKAGVHYPLMVNTTLTINGQSQSSVQYTDVETGILESTHVNVSVFPNPATDVLNVVGNDFSKGAYEVSDVLGKTVLNGTVTNGQINVNTLPSGIYILKLASTDNTVGVTKFQVRR